MHAHLDRYVTRVPVAKSLLVWKNELGRRRRDKAEAHRHVHVDGSLFARSTNIFSVYRDPELLSTWEGYNLMEAASPRPNSWPRDKFRARRWRKVTVVLG